MNLWMNELINKWMNELEESFKKVNVKDVCLVNDIYKNHFTCSLLIKEWKDGWKDVWMNEWMNESMNERMNEWMNE